MGIVMRVLFRDTDMKNVLKVLVDFVESVMREIILPDGLTSTIKYQKMICGTYMQVKDIDVTKFEN